MKEVAPFWWVGVNEGRPADVVPHLAGEEGEDDAEGDDAPGGPVVEELEVVASHVEEAADEHEQESDHDWAGVVGRAKDADLDVAPFEDPLLQSLGVEADPLDVHGVALLATALGGEVNDDGGGVEVESLEDVLGIVEVGEGKVETLGVETAVAMRVGHDLKLLPGLSTDLTAASRGEGGEHDDHGVVARRPLHVRPELVPVQLEHRLPQHVLLQVVDSLVQRQRLLALRQRQHCRHRRYHQPTLHLRVSTSIYNSTFHSTLFHTPHSHRIFLLFLPKQVFATQRVLHWD